MKMKAIGNRAFRSPYRKIPWKGFFEVPNKHSSRILSQTPGFTASPSNSSNSGLGAQFLRLIAAAGQALAQGRPLFFYIPSRLVKNSLLSLRKTLFFTLFFNFKTDSEKTL
jgi:hypothetical protein